MNLSEKIKEVLDWFNELTIKKRELIKRRKELQNKIEEEKLSIEKNRLAVVILKDYLGIVTDEIVELFESTVTAGLKRIFDDAYEFKLDIVTQKNKKTCNYMIHTGEYNEFLDISYTQGTCLKQIISVMIRIIMVSLDPTLPNVIILDEPFSGGDSSRMPAIAEFLKEITEKFNIQLIMVTHDEIFESYAEKIIRI